MNERVKRIPEFYSGSINELNPPAIVGENIAGRQQSVRRTLIKLSEDINRNTFDCAELLFEVQENKYYLGWKFESLPEYAATELNLKPRKSQYLARIARVMHACGIKRSDYEPAGITNLRMVSTLNPDSTYFNQETKTHESMAEHITELVAEAPELSTKEVEAEVNRLLGMDGENTMVHKSYSVTKSCYENTIQRCFEAVRMRLGSAGRDDTGVAKEYGDGAVLEALCAEYNADPRNFLEETDESRAQTEVPLEETNDHTPNQEGIGSTEALPHDGTDVYRRWVGATGSAREVGPELDSSEIPQEPLQGAHQPFVVSAED